MPQLSPSTGEQWSGSVFLAFQSLKSAPMGAQVGAFRAWQGQFGFALREHWPQRCPVASPGSPECTGLVGALWSRQWTLGCPGSTRGGSRWGTLGLAGGSTGLRGDSGVPRGTRVHWTRRGTLVSPVDTGVSRVLARSEATQSPSSAPGGRGTLVWPV